MSDIEPLDEMRLHKSLIDSIDPDAVWLNQAADAFVLMSTVPSMASENAARMRRIAAKLLVATQEKPKSIDGPKCQWCGDPMHKGTCPTISAMEFGDPILATGVPKLKRVEFHDNRRPTQNMSPEVVVATKKQE